MAEEDMIYGKNRHFFGGIEPSNMKVFTVTYTRYEGKNSAKIIATLPDNTVVGEQSLCTVAGAVIRRKIDSPPENEFDGDLVINTNVSGTFYDENVSVNTTYYYAAFPYTTQGVYRRDSSNRATVTIKEGYEPPALSTFTANGGFETSGAPFVNLVVGLDKDITDNGEVVDRVSSVTIRRSAGSYPTDETSGILVGTIEIPEDGESGVQSYELKDTSVLANSTYYYSAFPLSSTGIYNRDSVNRVSVTVEAGEAPSNMPYFTLNSVPVGDKPAVIIDIDMPTLSDGTSTIVTVPVRRKAGSYPTDISDGDLVVTFTESKYNNYSGHKRFWDMNVEDETEYFYRAFPSTIYGAVNNNDVDANKKSATTKASWHFYLTVDFTSASSEANRVKYSYSDGGEAWDNAEFTPVTTNADGTKNMGSWDFIPGTYFMPRPCVLNRDGTVAFYLNPNNYSKKEDNTDSNYKEYCTSTGANVMLEWTGPIQLGISHWPDYSKEGGGDGQWAPPFNIGRMDINFRNKHASWKPFYVFNSCIAGEYNDKFYSAAFPGSLTTNESGDRFLRSIPTGDIYFADNNATQIKADGENNNISGNPLWSVEPFSDNVLYTVLLMLMGKTLNLQSVFGNGRLGSLTTVPVTPDENSLCNTHRMFFGSTTANGPISAFGMQDLWGGNGRFILGSFLSSVRGSNSYPSSGYNENVNYWTFFYNVSPASSKGYNGDDGMTDVGFSATTLDKGSYAHLAYAWSYTGVNSQGAVSKNVSIPKTELGNGFLRAGDITRPWLYKGTSSLDTSTTNTTGTYRFNGLNGSATTGYGDYLSIVDYPTENSMDVVNKGTGFTNPISNGISKISNWQNGSYIPCHICGDKGNTTSANQKKDGPTSIYFSKTISGCNARLRYIPK